MPERDILGETVQRSIRMIASVRERMTARVPYGPLRANLTSKEARLQIQNLDPATRAKTQAAMGPDEWESLMERIYRGNNRPQSPSS